MMGTLLSNKRYGLETFGQQCRVCILTPHANVSNGGGTLCVWGSLSIPGVCPAIVDTIILVDKSIHRSHASMVSHFNFDVSGSR